MQLEISEQEYNHFFSLTYEDRLAYWDANQIDFTSQSFGKDNNVFLHICPYDGESIFIYSKWIINHWRLKLFNQPYDYYSTAGSQIIFKRFDEYVSKYLETIEKKNVVAIKVGIIPKVATDFLRKWSLHFTPKCALITP